MSEENKKSRRDFLRHGSAMGAVVAGIGLSRAGCAIDQGPQQESLNYGEFPLDEGKLDALRNDAAMRQDYLSAVNETVDALLDDPELHIKFMESCDPMLLMKLFHENRGELEPVVGTYDVSTREGRLAVILHSGELFHNVAGVDYAPYSNEVDPQWSVDGCSGTTNGCCVTHFWGWSGGDGGCC